MHMPERRTGRVEGQVRQEEDEGEEQVEQDGWQGVQVLFRPMVPEGQVGTQRPERAKVVPRGQRVQLVEVVWHSAHVDEHSERSARTPADARGGMVAYVDMFRSCLLIQARTSLPSTA